MKPSKQCAKHIKRIYNKHNVTQLIKQPTRTTDDTKTLTYLDWAFCQPNLKRLGGGHFGPPPNLAISSQITITLGKDILWVQIFTN